MEYLWHRNKILKRYQLAQHHEERLRHELRAREIDMDEERAQMRNIITQPKSIHRGKHILMESRRSDTGSSSTRPSFRSRTTYHQYLRDYIRTYSSVQKSSYRSQTQPSQDLRLIQTHGATQALPQIQVIQSYPLRQNNVAPIPTQQLPPPPQINLLKKKPSSPSTSNSS